jgi:type I restriction enzyme S subunit
LPIRALAAGGRSSFIDGDWIESPFITDEGIRLVQTGNIGVGKYREQGFRYISRDTFQTLNCTEVSPGDVLICRLADPVGRACLAPDLGGPMITSVDVCILKPSREHDGRFLVYLLSSPEYLGFMEGQCRGGTRDRVSRSFLGSVRVPVPPLPDQATIAAFLDRETGKIDALVEEQRRLLDLLKEKRQAVISHAVTKGLDPNAKMKPSGVEWMGDVPAHWEVMKCTMLGDLFGSELVDDGAVAETGEVPYLKVAAVSPDSLEIDQWTWFLPNNEVRTRSGFVVFPKRGAAILSNKVAVVTVAAALDPNLMGWAIRPPHSLRFYAYALKARGIETLADVSTVPQLNNKHIGPVRFPVPPGDEQRQIAAFLDTQMARFDRLRDAAQRSIDLLNERRSALISAAVTGKIDLRKANSGKAVAA